MARSRSGHVSDGRVESMRKFADKTVQKNRAAADKTVRKGSGAANKKGQLCPVEKRCGGCQLLGMEYGEQLRMKQRQIAGLLKGLCPVRGIIGMENPFHYRHKVHAVFSHDRRGNAISGIYQENTHKVVPVENCLIEDEQADASARKGLRIVMGVLAGILACVGIAGILSTTLGQIYQRKKEFARYVSIGVSPDEIKKMLFMEALFIVGRPFLLALLIDIPVTVLLLHAAPVTAGELLGHLPWMPVLLLLAVTAAVVAIAYMAAAGKICRQNIVETLKDDAII